MLRRYKAQPTRKRVPNKLIAGFAAFLTTGVITASGLAGATPMEKPSKEDCRKAGYSNYGQCVKAWAQNKPKPNPGNGNGHGYGGGNTSVVTNINVQINNSNNNVIQVIVNIFR